MVIYEGTGQEHGVPGSWSRVYPAAWTRRVLAAGETGMSPASSLMDTVRTHSGQMNYRPPHAQRMGKATDTEIWRYLLHN